MSKSNLEYGKCTSALNKSDKCVVSLVKTEKNKVEKLSQFCGGSTLERWNKNYNEFCSNNPGFATVFEKNDFDKFREYRLNLEETEKSTFTSKFEKLEEFIASKEFEKAALLYTELSKGKFSNNAVLISKVEIIQAGLNKSNTKISVLNTDEMNKIIQSQIESYKELFKDKSETIEIVFDQKGNGFVNDLPVKIRNYNPTILKEVGSFKVYCKSKGTFLLSTEQIQNPNKLFLDVWVEPSIKICKTRNKYFKKTFWSASVFKNEIKVLNNEQVPHGKYYKVRHDLKLYKVNSNEIYREELFVKDSEGYLSKRLWVKIGRGTGFLASMTWLTLRIIEYSSVK